MAQLDYREKGGYSTLTLPVMPRHGGEPVQALVYIGTRDNPHFIQDEPLLHTARVIAHTVGPSGPNREYMLNLAEAMRLIAPEHADEHLEELEEAVVMELGDAAGAQALAAAKAAVARAVADAIMAVESAVIAQKAEQIATATIEAALATAN
jgi:cation transport regulator ChaC